MSYVQDTRIITAVKKQFDFNFFLFSKKMCFLIVEDAIFTDNIHYFVIFLSFVFKKITNDLICPAFQRKDPLQLNQQFTGRPTSSIRQCKKKLWTLTRRVELVKLHQLLLQIDDLEPMQHLNVAIHSLIFFQIFTKFVDSHPH